jgi:hypothetical protein
MSGYVDLTKSGWPGSLMQSKPVAPEAAAPVAESVPVPQTVIEAAPEAPALEVSVAPEPVAEPAQLETPQEASQ